MKNNNKKYKINMKGLLLGLGGAVSVIAPVATLVACGGSNGNNDDSQLLGQLKDQSKQNSINSIESHLFSGRSKLPLNNHDVEQLILNTNKNGLLPVTRMLASTEVKHANDGLSKFGIDYANSDHSGNYFLNWAKPTPAMETYVKEFVKPGVKGQDGTNDQSLSNPLQTFTITKADILADDNNITKISDEINDLITANPTKKYAVITVDTIKDAKTSTTGLFDSGKYEVRVFEKEDNSTELDAAIALLKSDKFGGSKLAAQALQGFTLTTGATYTEGVTNSPFENGGIDDMVLSLDGKPNGRTFLDAKQNKFFKWDETNKVPTSTEVTLETFNKNGGAMATEEATMMAFSQFGPTSKYDSSTDHKALENIAIDSYLVKDEKTNVMNVVLNVSHADDNALNWGDVAQKPMHTETIYVPVPELMHYADNTTVDMNNLRELLTKKFGFQNWYKTINALMTEANVGQLNKPAYLTPATKNLIMSVKDQIPMLARVFDLFKNNGAEFEKMVNWIKQKDANFSLETFYASLTNYKHALPTSVGTELNDARLFALIQFTQIFYEHVSEYIEINGAALNVPATIDAQKLFEQIQKVELDEKIATATANWATAKADSHTSAGDKAKMTKVETWASTHSTLDLSSNKIAYDDKTVSNVKRISDFMTEGLTGFYVDNNKFPDTAFMNYVALSDRSFDVNTGVLSAKVRFSIAVNGKLAIFEKPVTISGFMTQAEIDAAKVKADQDAAADWAKYLNDNKNYLQNVKIDGLSHDQVHSIANWNKVLIDAETAGTLGKFASEPKATDFASVPALQHQMEVKSEISLQKMIKDNPKYLAGVTTGSMTAADINALVAWNKHLEAEQANLGTALVFATTLPTAAEKATIDATIAANKNWFEMNRDHKAEMDAAAVKLGTTIATATDADKAAIIAEAKKALEVDLSGLQAFIDNWHTQGKFIITSPLNALYSGLAKPGDDLQSSVVTNSPDYNAFKAELQSLITAKHQTYATNNGLGERFFKFRSSTADTVSITLRFDTKSTDNQIHHNSVDLTLYRH